MSGEVRYADVTEQAERVRVASEEVLSNSEQLIKSARGLTGLALIVCLLVLQFESLRHEPWFWVAVVICAAPSLIALVVAAAGAALVYWADRSADRMLSRKLGVKRIPKDGTPVGANGWQRHAETRDAATGERLTIVYAPDFTCGWAFPARDDQPQASRVRPEA